MHVVLTSSLRRAQERQKRHYDKSRREVVWTVGQEVLLSTRNVKFRASGTPKFMPKYIGPYAIEELIGPRLEDGSVAVVTAVRLQLPPLMTVHPVFHVSLLQEYRSDGLRRYTAPLFYDSDGAPVWEVECILLERGVAPVSGESRRKGVEYLVRWKGMQPDQDTWEPASVIREGAPQVVDDWVRRMASSLPPRPRSARRGPRPGSALPRSVPGSKRPRS